MNQLNVPSAPAIKRTKSIEDISYSLDQLPKNLIGMIPWAEYNYKPNVKFAITHSNDCLFLKFYVSEKAIRAVYCNTNDPVHKDSCVEFFVAFNNDKNYYNLEFNCIGTCHAGYGADRHERESLPEEVLSNIKSKAVIKQANKTDQNINWELTLIIPIEVFCKHSLTNFHGVKGKANFFKCGDDLPVPHYLAWNDIKSKTPNFHLSEYFGKMEFN